LSSPAVIFLHVKVQHPKEKRPYGMLGSWKEAVWLQKMGESFISAMKINYGRKSD